VATGGCAALLFGGLRLRGGRQKRRAPPTEVAAAKRQKGSADRRVEKVPLVKGSAIRLRAFPDQSPKIIVLVPLTPMASSRAALVLLRDAIAPQAERDAAAPPSGPLTLALPPHCSGGVPGQRVTLLTATASDPRALLDALKVADCVLLLHAGSELPDPTGGAGAPGASPSDGERALALLRAQGLPPVAIGHVGAAALPPKARTALRRARARVLEAEGLCAGEAARQTDVDDPAQVAALLRSLAARTPAGPAWRAQYAYMLGLDSWYEGPAGGGDAAGGTLTVRGFVRGRPLGADRLAHITGIGTFAVDSIARAVPPAGAGRVRAAPAEADMRDEEAGGAGVAGGAGAVLARRNDAEAEALESRPEDDPDDSADDGTDGGADGGGSTSSEFSGAEAAGAAGGAAAGGAAAGGAAGGQDPWDEFGLPSSSGLEGGGGGAAAPPVEPVLSGAQGQLQEQIRTCAACPPLDPLPPVRPPNRANAPTRARPCRCAGC
jgi:hypothetical protein